VRRRIFIGFDFIPQAGLPFSLSLGGPEEYDYGTVFIALALVIMLLLCGLVLMTAAAFVIHGTVTKNRFGVNLSPSECPRCHTVMPSVRAPQSWRQALWGGWSCPHCGCQVDKWGREI
jgi:hypothetical protein